MDGGSYSAHDYTIHATFTEQTERRLNDLGRQWHWLDRLCGLMP